MLVIKRWQSIDGQRQKGEGKAGRLQLAGTPPPPASPSRDAALPLGTPLSAAAAMEEAVRHCCNPSGPPLWSKKQGDPTETPSPFPPEHRSRLKMFPVAGRFAHNIILRFIPYFSIFCFVKLPNLKRRKAPGGEAHIGGQRGEGLTGYLGSSATHSVDVGTTAHTEYRIFTAVTCVREDNCVHQHQKEAVAGCLS